METEWDLLLWIPSKKAIIYCQDGSGDQLLPEDYEDGYNDYIDYRISTMNDDFGFDTGDAGIHLYNNANVANWQDKIPDLLKSEFGYVPRFVKLKMEMEDES